VIGRGEYPPINLDFSILNENSFTFEWNGPPPPPNEILS